ncbi:phospholipase D-like domain-containing protein [Bradyrhizobium pachyrhizi]|uniref:phospholipase D-like domain-containing protein n=1 Tax=Bradyrhizobium pachyrhizi TaxID=280333 RepID=UPI0024B049F4|nr:phospholipase D-like domain-containing protein [Bradyrhizobium pachyrhizi]WFU56832.1 phospholipase D-like domain-containing protein [Bradyrhizobium pachyrhizi]
MRAAIIIFFMIVPPLALAQTPSIHSDVVFTNPHCSTKRYLVETTDRTADVMTGPTGGYYCSSADFLNWHFETSDLGKTIDKMIGERKISRVALSDYYYSEKSFVDWLCSRSFTDEATIRVYYQHTTDERGHLAADFAQSMASCRKRVEFFAVGCDVFAENNKCNGGNVNILHSKVIEFELDNGVSVAVFGSGNLNKALYANIEDWVILASRDKAGFSFRYNCLFRTLDEVTGLRYAPIAFFSTTYRRCTSSWDGGELDAAPGVRFGILPADSDWFRSKLTKQIAQAAEIMISAQFLSDPAVVAALEASTSRIRVVLDDDFYWTLETKTPTGVVSLEDTTALEPLLRRPNVEVRYVMTNHHNLSGPGNTNHLRLIILRGQEASGNSVFTGSAHLRKGSLDQNIEMQLILDEPHLFERYVKFFEDLYERASTPARMPILDIPAR